MSDKQTPQSAFTGPIVIDPLTRIEGHLRIEVEVEEGRIKDARSVSTLFRGLENILIGRDPRDVQHFTQRTCGVCTYSHALASTRALEDAMGIELPKNATHIRNLVLGMLFLHDHIVHFYQLHALDFVDVTSALAADPAKAARLSATISPRPDSAETLASVQTKLKNLVGSGQLGPFTNAAFLGGHPAYYLDPESNLIATAHYLEALRLQVKAARAMAVFGGKNPHPQFLVAGGVTCYDGLSKERIAEFEGLYKEVRDFVNQVYLPDLLMVGGAYRDWTAFGGTSDFMTFGEFPGKERDLESRWLKPGLVYDRDISRVIAFDPKKIEEHVRHSWYEGETARAPFKGETKPLFTHMGDTDRYSWMKAPRYDGHAVETGPLAHMLVAYLQGQPDVQSALDAALAALSLKPADLFSTLGRTAARGVEAVVMAKRVGDELEAFKANVASGDTTIVTDVPVPQQGEGVGFVSAPRGGLSHWIVIEKGKVANFQLVVPSTWNLGPRCANGLRSAVEEALVGTPVADPKRPVEILRTVHSFDPCIACGVHVIDGRTNETHVFRVL